MHHNCVILSTSSAVAKKKNNSCSAVAVSSAGRERAEAVNHITSGIQSMEVDFTTGDLAEQNNSLVRSTSQDFNKIDASKEGKDGGNQSDNSVQRDEKSKQLDGCEESAEVKKRAMKSSTEAEEDESDFEEEDVKVCDICGDAGREDLLAVCSRCTDGAEHTYCMRKMLDQVPEGDWLCEECELNEEVEKQGIGNSEVLSSKERNKWSSPDSIRKSDNSARTKTDNNTLLKRIATKRPAESVEVEPSTKRQTLQSLAASPSSSGSIAPPARDISVKSSGSFVKSNSFGTSSINPKVSLVDENPQKHKKGVDVIDASRKLVGKSASFRGNINRSSAFESKVKMLSPEDSQILESRGLKQAKDRNILERKNSTKSDYSSCSQTVGNAGKHQARGEGKKNCPNTGGTSSVNGINAGDAKVDSVAIKEGLTSSSSRLEGSLTDHSERTSEKCYNNLREVVNAGSVSGNRRGSVLDSSLQRSSREVASEENKLKAAIQAAMQKKMDMDKKNKVSEKSNTVSVSHTDAVTETSSGDKLPNLVNSLGSSSYCKEAFMNNSVQSKELLTDYCKERDLDFVSLNGEMILRRSVVPEREFIWQGSFEVHKHGTIKDQIAGFQAHLSSCGSSKVSEIARKFPQKVALDEVPRSCTWPTQFKDSGIDEDNIALYFFAEDYESYQRSYKYLLEKMMKDDLALRGTIDGVELLIFPSKHLTLSSQRWNMLFFLWGVFRGRRASNLDMKSANFKKHDICALNAFPQGKDVASSSLSPSNKTCLLELEKENLAVGDSDHNVVNRCEASVPLEMPIHPSPVLSNGNCGSRGCSPDQSSLCRTGSVHHEKRLEDRSESPVSTRCESPCTIEHDVDRKMVADCQTTLRKEVSIDNSLHREVLLRSGDQISQLHGQSFGNNSSQPGGDSAEEKNMAPVDKDSPMELVNSLNKGQSSMGSAINQYSVSRKYDIWKGGQILDSLNHQGQAKPEVDADMSDLSHRNSLVHNFQQLFNGSSPNECSTISEARTNKGQKLPLNDVNDMLYVDNDEKRTSNRVARSSSFHGHDSSTGIDDAYTSGSLENNSRSKQVSYPDSADSRTAEKFFFPVDYSHSLSVVSDSLRGKVSSSPSSAPGKDDRLAEGSPSLELALGVENKKLKSGFFFTSGERDQGKLEDARRAGDVEEEGTASLSLSLAFPFADRERPSPGSVEDQDAFPQKREASTSFLLFRGLPDK